MEANSAQGHLVGPLPVGPTLGLPGQGLADACTLSACEAFESLPDSPAPYIAMPA
jgi:hypothetical protein